MIQLWSWLSILTRQIYPIQYMISYIHDVAIYIGKSSALAPSPLSLVSIEEQWGHWGHSHWTR
jgi:hypothetical protein